jgi:hypothetical protein
MEKEVSVIKTEAIKLCWYMRGGLTYDQSMALNHQERTIISELVNKNLETTKKTGLPFF